VRDAPKNDATVPLLETGPNLSLAKDSALANLLLGATDDACDKPEMDMAAVGAGNAGLGDLQDPELGVGVKGSDRRSDPGSALAFCFFTCTNGSSTTPPPPPPPPSPALWGGSVGETLDV